MKRVWTPEELIRHWTLESGELEVVNETRTEKNRLGLALLLKWFQYEGRFPRRKQEIPSIIVKFIARQLDTSPDTLRAYAWEGRTIERHRALIRQQLGFREATVQDAEELTGWLIECYRPDYLVKNCTFPARVNDPPSVAILPAPLAGHARLTD